jgi:outer membrane protein OmpA-like peptidoglycan-associated protein
LNAQTSGNEIHIALASDVLFDFDKAELKPEAIPSLEKLAIVLKSQPQSRCAIDGYSDSVGNDAYNQKLSQRRADAVKNWLAANGVSTQMATRGLGAANPVAPNKLPNGADNPAGRQKNRRVEITIQKG